VWLLKAECYGLKLVKIVVLVVYGWCCDGAASSVSWWLKVVGVNVEVVVEWWR